MRRRPECAPFRVVEARSVRRPTSLALLKDEPVVEPFGVLPVKFEHAILQFRPALVPGDQRSVEDNLVSQLTIAPAWLAVELIRSVPSKFERPRRAGNPVPDAGESGGLGRDSA